jgi:hypothetical protein
VPAHAAPFVTPFCDLANHRGQLSDLKLNATEPADLKSQRADAVGSVGREMGKDR